MTKQHPAQQHLPAIQATGLLTPSTATSTLSMLKAFPSSLSDQEFEQVKAIAKADVPSLPAIGPNAMTEALTMLDSSLPRRKTDTASGELRLRAYRQCLSHLRADQMWWTVQEAIKRCQFFPTVKELLDIAEGWERRDDATEAKRLAKMLVNVEVNRRLREHNRKPPPPPLTQESVDAMDPELKKLGLKLGHLIEQDGKVIPNPEPENAQ
jgi:hypothetical protein